MAAHILCAFQIVHFSQLDVILPVLKRQKDASYHQLFLMLNLCDFVLQYCYES